MTVPEMKMAMCYFDLQVNGYGGVDFNQDHLTADQLHRACVKLQEEGVEGFLATYTTEKLDLLCARIQRLIELRAQDGLARQLITGIHVEGPFINATPGYVGAHPPDAVIPATTPAAQMILDAGGGLVKLVTLAPECDEGLRVTALLARQGVRVAAGHTDASLDQLRGAVDAGLTMFTHLGNGCPMQMPRHDNIVQRALYLRDTLALGFIADGVHVAFVALKNYLDLAGPERAFVVTDAVAPAGMGPGRYTVNRWELLIGEDLVARAPDGSHLIGSAVTMPKTEQNLRDQLGLSEADCRRLLNDNPRRALGLP